MFKNPSFLFDIICTAAWIILVVRYARKGFLSSIVQLVGNLFSLLGAKELSAPCTARSSAYISTAKLGFTRNNNSFKCCKRFSLEDTSNKRYSFFANNFVNAKPIPPVAPVINTVFFMARPSFPVHTYHTDNIIRLY